MFSNSSSSWLSPTAPSSTLRSRKRQPFFYFFISSCKFTSNSVHYRSNNDSFSDSYSSRPYDRYFPEIRRRWVDADQPNASQERFTVVSYNILANRNAMKHRDMYPNVDPLHLKWEHRKRMICEELTGLKPDVICMQEVDKYYDLLKIMENAGYAASYKRRTGDNVDGCAMFWKADKFRLLERESIEYKALGLRDNVAQLSVFEIRFLLSRAHILLEKWGDIPVILAGDFNSTPQSAIYKFLASSELNVTMYNRKELSGQRNCHPQEVFSVHKEKNPSTFIHGVLNNCWTNEEIEVATGNAECSLLMHPLDLNSSYATVKGSTRTRNLNGEPLATSYHSKFLGTVDYLWYSEGIVPTRVLDTLPFDLLRRTGGLPCEKLGSDHLALVSEFAFTQ